MNRIGLKGLSWGTPCFGLKISLFISSILIDINLSHKKLLIHLKRFPSISKFFILWRKPACHTWSKAFSTLRNTAAVTNPLLVFCFNDWVNLNRLSCVLLLLQQPFCCLFIISFLLHHFLTLFVIIFFTILSKQLVRLSGRYVTSDLGFPGLWSIIIFDFLNTFG